MGDNGAQLLDFGLRLFARFLGKYFVFCEYVSLPASFISCRGLLPPSVPEVPSCGCILSLFVQVSIRARGSFPLGA